MAELSNEISYQKTANPHRGECDDFPSPHLITAGHSIQPLTFIPQVCATLQVPACPQFLKRQSQIVLLKPFSKFKVK